MKIAFLVPDYHRCSSQGRYVAELAERFSREHDVHVFANTFWTEPGSRVQFHKVPAWRPNDLASIFSFAISSSRYLDSSFDIIHDQGLCSFRNDVITAHSCNQAWAESRYCAPLAERVSSFVISRLERWKYRRSKARIISVSQRVGRDLLRCYGVKSNMDVIYEGVDAQAFHAGRCEDEVKSFLFVGDFRKGVMTCIRALSQLPSGTLRCIGSTPPRAYAAFARELGVADRVEFFGPTDNIASQYRCADALLLPTPYDGFGMVVLEAMASGLPVIVSREAGAAELITHSENGLILDHKEELPQLMRQLQSDHGLAAKLREQGRKTALEHSWDEVARATMAIYEEVRGAVC
jgi:glycosyltransferase involved in cell wall biosynthesis